MMCRFSANQILVLLLRSRCKDFNAFAKMFLDLPFGQIGKVILQKKLIIKSYDGRAIIDVEMDALKKAWQKTFDWK